MLTTGNSMEKIRKAVSPKPRKVPLQFQQEINECAESKKHLFLLRSITYNYI